MRNLSFIFLFAALLFAASGCEEDPVDPCETTICLNDGYCANGDCVCPDGYTAADCSQQETPDKIRITKIVVTKFPATDDGAGWDLTSGPDIYPELMLGNETIYSSSDFYQNADPSNNYTFDLSPDVNIDEPNDKYIIRLYDFDDFDPDDFMGGIEFTPYSSSNEFPDVLFLNAGGAVAFNLHLEYVW